MRRCRIERLDTKLASGLLLVQAVYFLATAVWPFVSMRSFLRVTGPKTDLWLVRTVAVLVWAIGLALGAAWASGGAGPEIVLLAVASAAGLAGIDIFYVARGTIAPIYLLDALAEAILIVLWVFAWLRPS